MTEYDLNLQYHPRRVNVVPDALSGDRLFCTTLSEFDIGDEKIKIGSCYIGEVARCVALQLQSSLIERIKEAQAGDKQLQKVKDQGGWTLRYGVRLCVPKGDMRQALLTETHNSSYSIHPGGTKMYQDLKQHFWWHGMIREIARFVSKYLVCQQVKAEHQRTAGLLQPLSIPE